MQSKRFTLNKTDLVKILKGAGIAALAAFFAYVTNALGLDPQPEPIQAVGDTLDGEMIADGVITPYLVVSLISVVINAIRLFWRE
jgi:hypothetical protein